MISAVYQTKKYAYIQRQMLCYKTHHEYISKGQVIFVSNINMD